LLNFARLMHAIGSFFLLTRISSTWAICTMAWRCFRLSCARLFHDNGLLVSRPCRSYEFLNRSATSARRRRIKRSEQDSLMHLTKYSACAFRFEDCDGSLTYFTFTVAATYFMPATRRPRPDVDVALRKNEPETKYPAIPRESPGWVG
jgi:hypothetical protein